MSGWSLPTGPAKKSCEDLSALCRGVEQQLYDQRPLIADRNQSSIQPETQQFHQNQTWLPTTSVGAATSMDWTDSLWWLTMPAANSLNNNPPLDQNLPSSLMFPNLDHTQGNGLPDASQLNNVYSARPNTPPEQDEGSMRSYATAHGPPFGCTVDGCGRTYTRMHDLRRHMNTGHERTVKFPCRVPACVQKNVAFYRSDHLTQHMSNKHSRSSVRTKRALRTKETESSDAQAEMLELRAEMKRLQDKVNELTKTVNSATLEVEMRKDV